MWWFIRHWYIFSVRGWRSMTGRVVIITGGNSGIGYEVAKYLCEGGNDVVLACRNREKGNEAVNKIKSVLPNSLVQCMEVSGATCVSQISMV